jgi:two-component system sensor histidine kinase YesM
MHRFRNDERGTTKRTDTGGPGGASLQLKVTLFSLALVLAPTLILGLSLYVRSTQILQSAVSASSLRTLSQTSANVGFVINEMRNVSLRLYQDGRITGFLRDEASIGPQEWKQRSLNVRAALASIAGASDHVDGIHLFTQTGESLSWSHLTLNLTARQRSRAVRLKGAGLISVDAVPTASGRHTHRVYLIRALNDINDISKRLGFVAVEADERRIADIYRYRLHPASGDFLILDDRGYIVSAADRSRVGRRVQQPELRRLASAQQGSGIEYVSLDGSQHAAAYYTEPTSGWRLVRLIPKELFLEENAAVREIALLGTGIALAVCLAIGSLFTAKIVRPIRRLSALMTEVEGENLDVTASVRGNDEIAVLGDSFNRMTARIRTLLQEVYFGTIKRREAELKALQAQVHPHFLYNSLDAIYWMARTEGATDTSELVRALSLVFRLSLNHGEEFTTVGSEIELLRNYMRLQQARYEDTLRFTIDCDPTLMPCKVVKLVLQPLVENAIQHGLEERGGEGTVTVSVAEEEGRLVYRVVDDGVGTDEAEIRSLLNQEATVQNDVSARGFGLRNVQERIALHFGPEYGIEFSSTPGHGTTVRVIQPKVPMEVGIATPDGR